MNAFLENAWYAAAWATEVAATMLPRRILGEDVVLYRRQDGRPAALVDRCPHRFAPLHLGKVKGDEIECGYHGLRFDCSGRCTFNPHGDGRPPTRATVRSFPVRESFGLLWIWMGDPKLSEDRPLPEFEFLEDPSYQTVRGYTLAEGHYELMTDNIMDLGHIEFLHPGLLGSEAVRRAKTEVRQDGHTVYSMRTTDNEMLPPFIRQWYEAGEGPVSRWLNVRWDAPANMKLSIGVLPKGMSVTAARESQGCHLMTPADESTSHYFWAQGRNWGQSDIDAERGRLESLRIAFDTQDKPMIEAVHRNMRGKSLDALKPVMLAGDAGAVRARLVLKRLIEMESVSSPESKEAAMADAESSA